MLGKTNITTLKEGGTVTEIEEFSWVPVNSGIRRDFKMAVFGNGILVGVTESGDVAYTADGEVWEITELGYAGCRINDVEWDGERFFLVGRTDAEGGNPSALIVATADFRTVERIELDRADDEEYAMIHYQNGSHVLVASKNMNASGRTLLFLYADLGQRKVTEGEEIDSEVTEYCIKAGKCTNGVLIWGDEKVRESGGLWTHQLLITLRSSGIRMLEDNKGQSPERSVIECRDELYVVEYAGKERYDLYKVTTADDMLNMCLGQKFEFISGVYFAGCRVFIGVHDMLIVRSGESIADKAEGDLLEIAPEMSMSCIVRAFGQLYIFGNQGAVLRSSTETDNGNVLVVQAVSARKALAEARKYADERYAELEARIAALETVQGGGA
mgnify:FL=1